MIKRDTGQPNIFKIHYYWFPVVSYLRFQPGIYAPMVASKWAAERPLVIK